MAQSSADRAPVAQSRRVARPNRAGPPPALASSAAAAAPASSRTARQAGRAAAAAVRGPALLGAAAARLRRSARRAAARRPGAGRARRQPHRPHVHRRPQRRLAVSSAAPRRLREPADLERPRRRPRAARRLHHGHAPLRAAAEQAAAGRDRRAASRTCWRSCGCSTACASSSGSGGIGWQAYLRARRRAGPAARRRAAVFGHGAADARSRTG